MSENIKKNLLKVREMRAYSYLILVKLFGDLPLITEPLGTDQMGKIQRSPFADGLELIKKDFEDAVRSKNTLYMVIENQDEIIGYAGMWLVLDEGEITNVSIKKSCWGQRAGTHLMEEFLKEAEKRGGTSFFLEVRESNLRARKLYRSFGFEEIDVRKKFYEEPVEDGIVMCKR